MPKKVIPIKYTSRDFDSIKDSLIDYVKRYYPETFRDFSEASFGSLMLDTVSYVGDVLSFYLDYQANESFLDTSVEYDNILRLGKQAGYKFRGNPSSYGIATFYVSVPAEITGHTPDMRYLPILKRTSQFDAKSGASFLLDEDVDFNHPNNEIRVSKVDQTTGVPTHYAVKAFGRVVSGRLTEEFLNVGSYQKFLRLALDSLDLSDVISVTDSEGHEYFETEYLSQDVIYRSVTNRGTTKNDSPALLKPFAVPRRFVVERERDITYLQFGGGSDVEFDSENKIDPSFADPSNVVLRRHGAPHISDASFDPHKLVTSDEFGVAPSSTTLKVVSRVNTMSDVNARIGSLDTVGASLFEFDDVTNLDSSLMASVRTSLEVINEEPIIGDVSLPDGKELKRRIIDVFAAQNRAVTTKDYEAMAYSMPTQFGAIKRCRILRDHDSFKRNLNMYIISENSSGSLVQSNSTLKENLKTWIINNKMVSDTIDILDAKIINISVSYSAIVRHDKSKFDILESANRALRNHFSRLPEIGEAVWITDIYTVLNNVEGIVDVTDANIALKSGGSYSSTMFNLDAAISPDGRYIEIPKNCIVELKFPKLDIKGTIK